MTARPGQRGGNDDFASMYEVLSRRFRRAREGDAGWELPDLIVIDGGKGQLGMALAAARDVGIDVRPGQGLPLVGLAKERDFEEGESVPGPEPESEAQIPPAQVEIETHTHSPSQTHTESSTENVDHLSLPEVPRRPAAPLPVPAESAPAGGAPEIAGRGVAEDPLPLPLPARRGRRRAPAATARSEVNARRPDRIYLPHAKDAIPIRPSSAEMFVLQHLRDEAHRFAVTFHRRRRSNLTLRSALGDVPGIGPQRQRLLLRHFGSLKKIRDATVADLAAVPGMTAKAAAAVFAHFGTATPSVAVTAMSQQPPSLEKDSATLAGPAAALTPEFTPPDANAPDDAEEEALESAFADVEDVENVEDLDADTPEHPEKS